MATATPLTTQCSACGGEVPLDTRANFCPACGMPLTAAADIYQYVDADGVVHFTTHKPGAPSAKVYMKSAPRPAGA